ncbi:hypothetical protein K377_03334 [Streptomyces sp. PsTaAH-137]|nr:hypothetical protein K377_03334 [Streptomyces sp. PsTaAH-137]
MVMRAVPRVPGAALGSLPPGAARVGEAAGAGGVFVGRCAQRGPGYPYTEEAR